MCAQSHFYLAELDAMPPDLDLMIHTSEELERSVGAEPCNIAGPIQQGTGSVAERIRQETVRRESGSLEIAARHSIAADVEFSGDAQGGWPQRGIEHVHLRVRDRPAYRNRPIDAVQAMGRGPDGRLRRAVHVDDGSLAHQVAELLRHLRGKCLATHEEHSNLLETLSALG